jgi:hypothetical protein
MQSPLFTDTSFLEEGAGFPTPFPSSLTIKAMKNDKKNNCSYVSILLDLFYSFNGRIGVFCDDCNDNICKHHPKKLNEKGLSNGYALNYVGEHFRRLNK